MLTLTFPASEVMVEQVGGRFTLFAIDLDSGFDVRIPLSVEGADSLRDDMNQTEDTAIQVLMHEAL